MIVIVLCIEHLTFDIRKDVHQTSAMVRHQVGLTQMHPLPLFAGYSEG